MVGAGEGVVCSARVVMKKRRGRRHTRGREMGGCVDRVAGLRGDRIESHDGEYDVKPNTSIHQIMRILQKNPCVYVCIIIIILFAR